MTSLRLAAALLVALLALPAAAAAPAQGRLDAAEAFLAGEVTIEAMGAHLLWEREGVPILTLHAAQLEVERTGNEAARVSGPVPPMSAGATQVAERAQHQDARITLEAGEGAQVVALRLDGTLAARAVDVGLRPLEGVLLADRAAGGDPCDNDGCLDALGVHEMSAAASDAAVRGDILLLLYGPTLRISDAAGESTYESGVDAVESTGPVTRTQDAWVLVRASGVAGTIAAPQAATWYSAAPRLDAAQASFEHATGALRVGGLDYRAHEEDVLATGRVLLAPEPVAPAPTHGLPGEPRVAQAFSAKVEGDILTINLGATPVLQDRPGEAAGILAVLTALVGGLAYYWPRLAFGAASLYTRLKKPDILDNDVRNAIYDIIRQNPGISAREVHRRSMQSWGTVVYHLRQLERHHLVVSREIGRTRNYYENHGKYRGMEAQLACLQSDRARALARAIVARPGITQEQLAEAAGFPQPTTSYYVRKLKQAGLVDEVREGRYARYVPHADLARYVQMADQPTVGRMSSSGVDA